MTNLIDADDLTRYLDGEIEKANEYGLRDQTVFWTGVVCRVLKQKITEQAEHAHERRVADYKEAFRWRYLHPFAVGIDLMRSDDEWLRALAEEYTAKLEQQEAVDAGH